MKKDNIVISIILIFILLNAIIVFLWPIRTNLKLNNYKPYSDEFIESLNLNKDEALKLYLETWQRERMYDYDELTSLRESLSIGQYVNVNKDSGRLISNNPNSCEKNVFVYGGARIFGYDVTDNQTIPYYLREILKKNELNHCVFNFGRATYYSTQENILFQKHLLKNKIKENDLLIFLDGDNEQGNRKLFATNFIEENYISLHQKYWLLYKTGVKNFIELLPVRQLIEVLYNKTSFKKKKDKLKSKKVNNKSADIANVFDKNIKIRNAICSEYNLQCHSFLFFSKKELVIPEVLKKYTELKSTENIYDLTYPHITNILSNKHNMLSPGSNQILAEKIYQNIIN
jgi:hypothetical protein